MPFIIELPTLCFKVHVSMSLAAQQEELPYFELIQTPIRKNNNHSSGEVKNIGHKCLGFFATCSVFILIGDGYIIYFEPYGWNYERKTDLKNNILSLDDAPAKEYEAWEIYSLYEKYKDSEKVEQMIEYLNTDQIKPEHIKEHFSDFLGHYKTSNRINEELINSFEQAVGSNVLRGKLIERKKKRVEISEINLLMSYQYILSKQPSQNKAAARREAISLLYPDISADELAIKDEAIKSKIKYHLKESEEIEFLFPSASNGDSLSRIRHHFENREVSEENEFSLILGMVRNGVFK